MRLIADGTIRQSDQGPFDPTHLAGPVFSRRFTAQRHDGRWVVVVDHYGVVSLPAVFPEEAHWFTHQFDVLEKATFIVCDDPDQPDQGDSQDYSPDEFPSHASFPTVEEAAVFARHCAEVSVSQFFPLAAVVS